MSSLGVRVRLATEEDLEEVHAMDRRILNGPPASPDTVHYVAEACSVVTGDAEIIGYGGVRLPPEWPGIAFLGRAGVVPEYRGRGIQKRLIRARVAWARRTEHASHVVTYTSIDNAASSNSLIAAGFRLYVPSVPYVGDSYLYWRKQIQT